MNLQEVKLTYSQDADSCDPGDYQFLTIETMDGGAGPFLVIGTPRWALDFEEIDAFAELLREAVRLQQRGLDGEPLPAD